jgi:hypothetical protein
MLDSQSRTDAAVRRLHGRSRASKWGKPTKKVFTRPFFFKGAFRCEGSPVSLRRQVARQSGHVSRPSTSGAATYFGRGIGCVFQCMIFVRLLLVSAQCLAFSLKLSSMRRYLHKNDASTCKLDVANGVRSPRRVQNQSVRQSG